MRNLSKSELQELALSLIYNLSDYELDEFALYHLDDDLYVDDYEDDFDEDDYDEDHE